MKLAFNELIDKPLKYAGQLPASATLAFILGPSASGFLYNHKGKKKAPALLTSFIITFVMSTLLTDKTERRKETCINILRYSYGSHSMGFLFYNCMCRGHFMFYLVLQCCYLLVVIQLFSILCYLISTVVI